MTESKKPVLFGLIAAALALAGPAPAQEIKLTFADQNSPAGWGPAHALQPWVKQVEEATKGRVHDLLGLANDPLEVRLVPEALRVDLVDVLRARGTRREPAARRHDLQAADGGTVALGGVSALQRSSPVGK